MKNIFVKFLNIAPIAGVLLAVLLAVFIFSGRADAKYKPSPATSEMSKVIERNQERVKRIDEVVASLNQERDGLVAQAKIFRETICRTEKEACTKQYLDPLNAGTDLSSFLVPAAK